MSGFAARALIWGVVLASATGLIWLLIGWLELDPTQAVSQGFQPDIALHEVTLTHYGEHGLRQWTLTANRIAIDEKSRSTVAEAVDVRFWRGEADDGGVETLALSIQAQTMVLDNVRQDMVFEGALSASDDQGLTFSTSQARWHQQEQVLEGEEFVSVKRGELSLEGKGFRFDVRSGALLLKEDARLRWTPEGGS